jgi:hypothetical protein
MPTNIKNINNKKLDVINNDIFSRIIYGVRLGAAKAHAEHKRLGIPIAIWKNGKIVHIPPEKITVPKEFEYLLKNA